MAVSQVNIGMSTISKKPDQSKLINGMNRCETKTCDDCDKRERGRINPCIHHRDFGDIKVCLWTEKENDDAS